MKIQITPNFIALIYEACLKSFWRRQALRRFLKNIGISQGFLATWEEEETKRKFLDRLFDKLPNSEKGEAAILRMAEQLAEQKIFPDLINWEDSEIKIREAHKATQSIRYYLDEQKAILKTMEEERKRIESIRQQQEQNIKLRTSLETLTDNLTSLISQQGTQKGGYSFQNWFYEFVSFFEIHHKRPYVTSGRQIDGTITHEGTTYLVELKFISEQVSVTGIDSLLAKINSKVDNTMGLFVSMSGYSSTSIAAASIAKTPLLLIDHSHIYTILRGIMTLPEVIERIRRHASQTGKAFLPVDQF